MPNKTELEQAEDQLRLYKSLNALKDTEGGKVLIAFHKNAIDVQVNWLVSNYKDASDTEIRARISKIESSQDNINMIANAKQNAEVVKEQIESLKE